MSQPEQHPPIPFYLVPLPTPGAPLANGQAPARTSNLWMLLPLGLTALAGYECATNFAAWSGTTLFLATLVMFLGAVPMMLYLKRGTFRTIPFFEGHCLFYTLSFGYAGFRPVRGITGLTSVTEYYIQLGMVAAVLCLLCLFVGFYGFGARLTARLRPFSLGLPDTRLATSRYLLAELAVLAFVIVLKRAGLTQLEQVATGLKAFVFIHFIACQHLGLLPRWASLFFWLVFMPWMLLIGSGLINGRIMGLIAFAMWQTMALLWARRKISPTWLVIAALVMLVFQPVKGIYREHLWGRWEEYTMRDRIGLFFRTLIAGQDQLQTEEAKREAFEEAYSRVNQLILTACVIRDTPRTQPYRNGQTYVPLLSKWIPRLIWKNKPIEDLGNRWGREYGYLDRDDYQTSLNLPWLTEMFINFGWLGVITIPLALGVIFRWLWMKLARAPANAMDFSLAVVLLGPQILVESHLSMIMGDIIVGFISLMLILKGLRLLLGRPGI